MAITHAHVAAATSRSSWVASGGYDFRGRGRCSPRLAVDGVSSWSNDRRAVRRVSSRCGFVPKGGRWSSSALVTTKRPELEFEGTTSSAGSTRRPSFVPLDQICLSGQCGFSSTFEGNALTYDEAGGQAPPESVERPPQEVWGLATRFSGLTPGRVLAAHGTRAATPAGLPASTQRNQAENERGPTGNPVQFRKWPPGSPVRVGRDDPADQPGAPAPPVVPGARSIATAEEKTGTDWDVSGRPPRPSPTGRQQGVPLQSWPPRPERGMIGRRPTPNEGSVHRPR